MHLTITFDTPQAPAALFISPVAIRTPKTDGAKADGRVDQAPPGWFG